MTSVSDGGHGRVAKRWLALGWVVAALSTSCGDNSSGGSTQATSPGYQVTVEIHGTQSAFAGRTVIVNGQRQGPIAGTVMAFGLCTTDRDKFFHSPLEIEVFDGGALLSKVAVNRYACALSDNPGPEEFDVLILSDDGRVSSDFSSNDGAYTSCEGPNDPFVCRHGETL